MRGLGRVECWIDYGGLWNGEREDLKYELERSAELRKVI